MTDPPPEGWPPPGGWPPPYPYGPPPKSNDTVLVVGLAVVGAFTYFLINFVAGPIVLVVADGGNQRAVIATGAAMLALLAFGGGGALLALRKPWAKGLGLGLMIGWALTSLLTVGICTGLNPTLYQSL